MSNCLYINKPKGMTSFDLCFKLRRVLGTKKIGHTGTLDPNATGVMVVLFNESTKANQFLVTDTKEYVAEVLLGIKTDTLDIDGNILLEKEEVMPSKEELERVLASFLGESMQRPPMTSAIKVDGRKLYEYQRKGQEVEIPLRKINVSKIELLEIKEKSFVFSASVSSGTYIRTLAEDILTSLGLIGTLKELCRTRVDHILLKDCDNFEDVMAGRYQLHDVSDLLSKRYPVIDLKDPTLALHGRRMRFDSDAERVLITSDHKAIAMYERDGDEYHCQRGLL